MSWLTAISKPARHVHVDLRKACAHARQGKGGPRSSIEPIMREIVVGG